MHACFDRYVGRQSRAEGSFCPPPGDRTGAVLTASIDQARVLGTARESWISRAALGQILTRLGQDREAEAQLIAAADTIESIATNLVTPHLRQSFLGASRVADVFQALGRGAPRP